MYSVDGRNMQQLPDELVDLVAGSMPADEALTLVLRQRAWVAAVNSW